MLSGCTRCPPKTGPGFVVLTQLGLSLKVARGNIMAVKTEHVLYAYIAKPTTTQVSGLLRALANQGVSISHLGKSDPPRKFRGSIDEAVSMVFSSTDLTNYTHARDVAWRLDLDFCINNHPGGLHSTVSASCPDKAVLGLVADSAAEAFDLFIAIRGVLGGGKEQPWEVVHVTNRCPQELRSRFVVT